MYQKKQDESRKNYAISWDLIAFYTYALKLGLETLMNRIIDLLRHVDDTQKSYHGAEAIQKVFHRDAILKEPLDLQVYVAQLAVHMMRLPIRDRYYTINNADFVNLLQIKEFAEQFVNANRMNDVADPRTPDTRHMCHFHVHNDFRPCEARRYIPNCLIEN